MAHDKAEIMNVAVAETHQGKEIGKALVQISLYQKCGFRLKEIIHDYFVDNYDETIFENGIQCRDMVRLEISF